MIQTVSIVLKDLDFKRRVLREMQEQKIAYALRSSTQGQQRIAQPKLTFEILFRILSGMGPTPTTVDSSSVRVSRLFTISN